MRPLQNPDIVLVHYLNVPAIEDCGKPCGPILCSINTDKKEWAKWTKEELIGQLKPMCECLIGSVLSHSPRPLLHAFDPTPLWDGTSGSPPRYDTDLEACSQARR